MQSANTAIHHTTTIFKVDGSAIRVSIAGELCSVSEVLCSRIGTILRVGGTRERVHNKGTAGRGCDGVGRGGWAATGKKVVGRAQLCELQRRNIYRGGQRDWVKRNYE